MLRRLHKELLSQGRLLSGRKVVLGIETTFDDTGAGVVTSDREVLGEHVVSQWQVHEKWGGTVPALAAMAHRANIEIAVNKAMQQAKIQFSELDAIAVATGPGQAGALRTGVDTVKGMALVLGKPVIAVNHLEAHVLTARLSEPQGVSFPFLCVLVTGGNTQILLCKGLRSYKLLGHTLDDPIGEVFDKVARELGIAYTGHGGAALEKLALQGRPGAVKLKVPMSTGPPTMNMSFGGLKHSVKVQLEKQPVSSEQDRADVALAFQDTAIQHLSDRVSRAVLQCSHDHPDLRTVVLCGGVSKNAALRSRLSELCTRTGRSLVVTPPRLCTDNGVMIAWAGVEQLLAGPLPPFDYVCKPDWPLDPEAPDKRESAALRLADKLQAKRRDRSRNSNTCSAEDRQEAAGLLQRRNEAELRDAAT